MILLLLLPGCFLYDYSVGNNIDPFIDPLINSGEGFIPESNAVKVISLDVETPPEELIEETPEEDDGIIVIDENHIYLKKPPIEEVVEDNQINYYYEGDTFRFQVSFLWRKTMEVDILTEVDGDYDITYYTFYFVPEGQPISIPQKAEVMSLRIVPYKYYQLHGHGENGVPATEKVTASDGYVYTYLSPSEEVKLDEEFPDIDGYSSILRFLTTNWNFKHVERQ